jgi:transcriptional regulator with XRE-family HTH domain
MSMTIFEFDDYKKFVDSRIKDYPSGGRGVFKLMAEAMKVPRSTLSQVFNGERDLTFEQAIDLAGFLELSSLETDFFMALVERSRAGNPRLRSFAELKKLWLPTKKKRCSTRSGISRPLE